eukprot:tig00001154_g7299.t1
MPRPSSAPAPADEAERFGAYLAALPGEERRKLFTVELEAVKRAAKDALPSLKPAVIDLLAPLIENGVPIAAEDGAKCSPATLGTLFSMGSFRAEVVTYDAEGDGGVRVANTAEAPVMRSKGSADDVELLLDVSRALPDPAVAPPPGRVVCARLWVVWKHPDTACPYILFPQGHLLFEWRLDSSALSAVQAAAARASGTEGGMASLYPAEHAASAVLLSARSLGATNAPAECALVAHVELRGARNAASGPPELMARAGGGLFVRVPQGALPDPAGAVDAEALREHAARAAGPALESLGAYAAFLLAKGPPRGPSPPPRRRRGRRRARRGGRARRAGGPPAAPRRPPGPRLAAAEAWGACALGPALHARGGRLAPSPPPGSSPATARRRAAARGAAAGGALLAPPGPLPSPPPSPPPGSPPRPSPPPCSAPSAFSRRRRAPQRRGRSAPSTSPGSPSGPRPARSLTARALLCDCAAAAAAAAASALAQPSGGPRAAAASVAAAAAAREAAGAQAAALLQGSAGSVPRGGALAATRALCERVAAGRRGRAALEPWRRASLAYARCSAAFLRQMECLVVASVAGHGRALLLAALAEALWRRLAAAAGEHASRVRPAPHPSAPPALTRAGPRPPPPRARADLPFRPHAGPPTAPPPPRGRPRTPLPGRPSADAPTAPTPDAAAGGPPQHRPPPAPRRRRGRSRPSPPPRCPGGGGGAAEGLPAGRGGRGGGGEAAGAPRTPPRKAKSPPGAAAAAAGAGTPGRSWTEVAAALEAQVAAEREQLAVLESTWGLVARLQAEKAKLTEAMDEKEGRLRAREAQLREREARLGQTDSEREAWRARAIAAEGRIEALERRAAEVEAERDEVAALMRKLVPGQSVQSAEVERLSAALRASAERETELRRLLAYEDAALRALPDERLAEMQAPPGPGPGPGPGTALRRRQETAETGAKAIGRLLHARELERARREALEARSAPAPPS